MAEFAAVMKLTGLGVGSMRACAVGGRELSEGRLRSTRLWCPLHGACFDVRDGRVLGSPAEAPLPTHAVRVVDGTIEVAVGAVA